MSEQAIDRILSALDARGCRYTLSGGQYKAQCSNHNDRDPSLSLRQVEGQVLMKCWGGCTTPDVMASLGLSMSDLFDDPHGARYDYTDAEGRRTRSVYRTPDKRFRQSGETRIKQLYRLPQVIAAVAASKTVYLVEGEKDVHSLEALGACATTGPEGADRISDVDVSPLKGAHVVAVADNDAAGARWAAEVQRRLGGGYAASLRLMRAKVGKDASDHVVSGHGLDDFEPFESFEAALDQAPGPDWEDPLPLG